MAAPSPTARTTPTGIRLRDGYQSLITLGNEAGIDLWETETTPVGAEGGDPISTTTMHNVLYHTKSPRTLVDTTPSSMVCAFDPAVLEDIMLVINDNQQITQTFPDGSTWAFWGWLRSFVPNGMSEGDMPLADVVIESSNTDDSFAEQAVVIASVSGT